MEREDGQAQDVGRPGGRGDAPQESEPSWYRTSFKPDVMESMVWHRRETRRQTENTNGLLRWMGKTAEKRGEQTRVEGRRGGRWIREVKRDAAEAHGTFTSAL